jgi:cell division protein FtsQ
MKRRMVLFLASGAVAVTALLVTPLLLRRLDFFQVRQVELLGVRYLSPDVVLEALALRPDQNLFDDLKAMAERALRVEGVTSARVLRRLPGTLRVVVTERMPMAFAPGPQGFVTLDALARPLPYDPTENDLDLPIVAHPDTLLVGALGVVRFANPNLYHQVGWVDFDRSGGIGLTVGDRRILLPDLPSSDLLDAVQAVRQHLAAGRREYDELDARFGGWIVVRRSGA